MVTPFLNLIFTYFPLMNDSGKFKEISWTRFYCITSLSKQNLFTSVFDQRSFICISELMYVILVWYNQLVLYLCSKVIILKFKILPKMKKSALKFEKCLDRVDLLPYCRGSICFLKLTLS